MSCTQLRQLNRRRLLAGTAASLAMWGLKPRAGWAAPARDPRLLTVILRGGLDGISIVAPIGDPDYERLRGKLALTKDGPNGGLPLDGFFVLNPSMPFLHQLYQRREALVVHAVATPYRARSHFDGQDVLESGLAEPGHTENGWLNRALAGLAAEGKADPRGLAIGAVVPLVIRGPAPVLSWIPKTYDLPLRDSTVARLMDLYARTDAKLAKALAEGLDVERVAMSGDNSGKAMKPEPGGARAGREFVETAEAAARFLRTADGPRIGVLAYNGWDTHANEGVVQGQLANRLAGLDLAIKTLAEGMGPAWKDTIVALVTEFGRTAAVNGTQGTDHGTATVALLLGGAVNGGRIIADWPGLAPARLFDGRDLAPTRDLRAVLKGILGDHLGVPPTALSTTVFPGSSGVEPLRGLIL